MSKTYRIERISDLFAVPVEKREQCVSEILRGLLLLELACGDEAAASMYGADWTDDEDESCFLVDQSGTEQLRMEVTLSPPADGGKT